MVTLMVKGMKPDPSMMCNGMLAGLVAITAPCAFVDPWGAGIIGAIAGVLVVLSVFFFDGIGVDDPVGAISVHGINGLWGVISVGIFANGKYGAGWGGVEGTVGGLIVGDTGQFFAQLIDAGVVAVFGFTMAFIWFKISNLVTPLRVTPEIETQGLDSPEMGALGYPDFTVSGRTMS
jgi:ammonium transporter, Amt family